MFLKLLEPIFTILSKNVKLALLAILLSVLITWIIYGEIKIKSAKDECIEDRNKDREADQATIISQAEELKDMRIRLFDAFMQQRVLNEQTQHNDSLMRVNTQRALNKIQK